MTLMRMLVVAGRVCLLACLVMAGCQIASRLPYIVAAWRDGGMQVVTERDGSVTLRIIQNDFSGIEWKSGDDLESLAMKGRKAGVVDFVCRGSDTSIRLAERKILRSQDDLVDSQTTTIDLEGMVLRGSGSGGELIARTSQLPNVFTLAPGRLAMGSNLIFRVRDDGSSGLLLWDPRDPGRLLRGSMLVDDVAEGKPKMTLTMGGIGLSVSSEYAKVSVERGDEVLEQFGCAVGGEAYWVKRGADGTVQAVPRK